jgi:hypothetical protein
MLALIQQVSVLLLLMFAAPQAPQLPGWMAL